MRLLLLLLLTLKRLCSRMLVLHAALSQPALLRRVATWGFIHAHRTMLLVLRCRSCRGASHAHNPSTGVILTAGAATAEASAELRHARVLQTSLLITGTTMPGVIILAARSGAPSSRGVCAVAVGI
jgi:hypothetical protein